MKKQEQKKLENLRIAIGCTAIVAVVGLTSIAVTMLGLAQMA